MNTSDFQKRPVYTVGTEEFYDEQLRVSQRVVNPAEKFAKIGRRKDYAGGFAVASFEDAQRLIEEFGKEGVWAVYRLDADWNTDTLPSMNGWWNALIKTSTVLCKVDSDNNLSN